MMCDDMFLCRTLELLSERIYLKVMCYLQAIRHGPCVLFIVFISLEFCFASLWKLTQKQSKLSVYLFLQCPDYFVVGYGMDFAELYRNLPYVGVLKPEHYK